MPNFKVHLNVLKSYAVEPTKYSSQTGELKPKLISSNFTSLGKWELKTLRFPQKLKKMISPYKTKSAKNINTITLTKGKSFSPPKAISQKNRKKVESNSRAWWRWCCARRDSQGRPSRRPSPTCRTRCAPPRRRRRRRQRQLGLAWRRHLQWRWAEPSRSRRSWRREDSSSSHRSHRRIGRWLRGFPGRSSEEHLEAR